MENYHTTKKQLEWLAERVVKLKELTQDKRGTLLALAYWKEASQNAVTLWIVITINKQMNR